MNREQKCKEFYELNGGHWHKWENRLCDPNRKIELYPQCIECGIICKFNGDTDNPTFSHPEEVLEVMMGRKDFDQFAQPIFKHFLIVIERGKKSVTKWAIPTCYITEHGKLFDAAHLWSVEHKEGR